MIIDIHNHPDWFGMNYQKFTEDMKRNGISKVCLLSSEAPVTEYNPIDNSIMHHKIGLPNSCPISFSQCLDYYQKAPDKFILGFAPDPRQPAAIDRLKAAISLYQVKICGEVKFRMMYDNPDAVALFRLCGEKGIPVLFHLESPIPGSEPYTYKNYWYGGNIDTIERVLKQCPDTTFIGHALSFWSEISESAGNTGSYPEGKIVREGKLQGLMRRYKNLYADISARSGFNALNRDKEYAVHFLTEFQDRVVYGRDTFDTCHRDLIDSLKIDQQIREKIYGKNAEKLLQL